MAIDLDQPALAELCDIYSQGIGGGVVFWVGAGLSREAKLPSWIELRDILIQAARRKAATMEKADAESIRRQISALLMSGDLWQSFDVLFELLNRTSYIAEIRKSLEATEKADTPEIYRILWNLHIHGIVSLNVDDFAIRSCFSVRNIPPAQFVGRGCGPYIRVLKMRRPFVANLHGIHDDVSSWVFRARDISALQEMDEYRTFIGALFASKTIVFIGISGTIRLTYHGTIPRYSVRQGIGPWPRRRSSISPSRSITTTMRLGNTSKACFGRSVRFVRAAA